MGRGEMLAVAIGGAGLLLLLRPREGGEGPIGPGIPNLSISLPSNISLPSVPSVTLPQVPSTAALPSINLTFGAGLFETAKNTVQEAVTQPVKAVQEQAAKVLDAVSPLDQVRQAAAKVLSPSEFADLADGPAFGSVAGITRYVQDTLGGNAAAGFADAIAGAQSAITNGVQAVKDAPGKVADAVNPLSGIMDGIGAAWEWLNTPLNLPRFSITDGWSIGPGSN